MRCVVRCAWHPCLLSDIEIISSGASPNVIITNCWSLQKDLSTRFIVKHIWLDKRLLFLIESNIADLISFLYKCDFKCFAAKEADLIVFISVRTVSISYSLFSASVFTLDLQKLSAPDHTDSFFPLANTCLQFILVWLSLCHF